MGVKKITGYLKTSLMTKINTDLQKKNRNSSTHLKTL